MKILITGANGFLGYYLTEKLLQKKYTVVATGKGGSRLPFTQFSNLTYSEMDFTLPSRVHEVFEKYSPDVVIHAGAMSKPDDCEQDRQQAYRVNVEGTLTLLLKAAETKSFFVYVSSDFIFDGDRGMYREEDDADPVNFYGKTKLVAEEAVKVYEYDWAIVRTVLVYGKPHAGRTNCKGKA